MGSIALTEKATTELRKIIREQKLPDQIAVRLGVKGGGCSGFTYAMGFDEGQPTELDETIEADGIPIYVDKKSLLYLDGMVVDFHEDLMQRGFVFKNPNATGTCGCGESFNV